MISLSFKSKLPILVGFLATTFSALTVYGLCKRLKKAEKPRPFVGVSVFLKRADGKLLVGRRLNSHGANTIAFPGGHLEYAEDINSCASRELNEETGICIPSSHFKLSRITSDIFEVDGKHYITLIIASSCPDSQEAKIMEPEKCSEWFWMSPQELLEKREELFLPLRSFIESEYDLPR